VLLIREHQQSYDALVEVLDNPARSGPVPVGEAVFAIEKNLPAVLPSLQRIEERKKKDKAREADMLLRYVQRLTWRVGGIQPSVEPTVEVNDDGFIVSPASPSEIVLKSGPPNRDDTTVARFAEKIARLEEEVKHGQVDVADGGVWLNGLQSLSKNVTTDLPKPIPGYEDRIRVLLKADGERSANDGEAIDAVELNPSASGVGHDNEIHKMFSLSDVLQDSKPNVATAITTSSLSSSSSPESSQTQEAEGSPSYMLKTHRGFQMKRLENIMLDIQKKAVKIESRLKELTHSN